MRERRAANVSVPSRKKNAFGGKFRETSAGGLKKKKKSAGNGDGLDQKGGTTGPPTKGIGGQHYFNHKKNLAESQPKGGRKSNSFVEH